MKNRTTETHYETLRVHREATVTEIVAAYHSAKNAFSGDSVATYSLFTNDEIREELARLDAAFATLSNLERKREYDDWLDQRREAALDNHPTPAAPQVLEQTHSRSWTSPNASPVASAVAKEADPEATPSPRITVLPDTPITGALLRKLRESRSMSLQDVSRITKIPTKFIEAIENDVPNALPARVYLQGFVKNLAVFYHLDATHAAQSYLSRFNAAA